MLVYPHEAPLMKHSRPIHCFIPVLLIAGLGGTACKAPITQTQTQTPPPPKAEVKPEIVNTDLDLLIHGTSTMNRDAQGNALSVVLHLYQLKSKEGFNRLTLEMTYSDQFEQEHLGDALVSKTECVVTPGEKKGLKLKFNPETKYVGAIAFYRNPDKHHWRGIVETKASTTIKQVEETPEEVPETQAPEPQDENYNGRTKKKPIKAVKPPVKNKPAPQPKIQPPPPVQDTQIKIKLHDCYLEFENPKPDTIPGIPTAYKPNCG